MKISTKCRYGARAIIEIARGSKNEPIKRKTIVDNQQIPDSYLKNILILLKEAGLIKAIRGSNGGYVLSRPATDITFLEIIQALEGSLALADCVTDPDVCDRVEDCVTRDVWRKMTKAQEDVLRGITIKELIEKDGKSESLNYTI